MPSSLLDPKNDVVFKLLFARHPALLADLINAVRHDQPPVEVVDVLNPRIEPDELSGKFIVLDVLARDEAGRRYNIEMQVRQHANWNVRSAYYLARTFVNQLQSGQDYGQLCPTIGIHLMDFDLFDDPEQAHWRFELRDRDRPQVALTQELQLNLIELPKADGLRPDGGVLGAWVAYFEHWQESTVMNDIAHAPVKQALEHLQDLSADEETRRMAFVRERALRDEISALREAREEGLEEGLEKGREEGREEGRHETQVETARRLIESLPLDDAAIARLSGLTAEEVRALRTQP